VEIKNVCLGLCTDGFNPFRLFVASYFYWSVILMVTSCHQGCIWGQSLCFFIYSCCNPILAHWLFNLILQGLKCKIKISEIYFDEKCDLSTCVKTRDYNILLSFYHYLQDNPYLQDNDSYPLLNFILNQIQTSKKRMSLIETLFLTHEGTLAL